MGPTVANVDLRVHVLEDRVARAEDLRKFVPKARGEQTRKAGQAGDSPQRGFGEVDVLQNAVDELDAALAPKVPLDLIPFGARTREVEVSAELSFDGTRRCRRARADLRR